MSSTTITTSLPTGRAWQALDAEAVHKRRADAVLLRHWRPEGTDRFAVRFEWPERHHLFCPARDGRVPLLTLVVESVRQVGIAIPHLAYDVPRSSAFAMSAIDGHLADATSPARHLQDVVAEVEATDVVLSPTGVLRSMTVVVTFVSAGMVVACGTGSLVVLAPGSYARVRGGRPVARTAPVLPPAPGLSAPAVGRLRGRDVVLGSQGAGDLRLRLTPEHPWFFDHPTDHVPGMVLVEAAQQAILAGSHLVPVSLRAAFHRYAELDADVEIASEAHGQGLRVDFSQGGAMVATIEVGGRSR